MAMSHSRVAPRSRWIAMPLATAGLSIRHPGLTKSLSAWELAAAPGSGAENKNDLMTVLMHV